MLKLSPAAARRLYYLAVFILVPAIALGATFKITGGTITYPSGTITDDAISATAAIAVDKLQHIHKPGTNFDLAVGGTPVTREETVFVASTAGTIHGFHWLLTDTGSSTSIAWDLKKNGTTVLSGAGSSTHSDSDGTVKDGSLSVLTFAANDRFTISMTVSSATGAQGPFAWADLEEAAP